MTNWICAHCGNKIKFWISLCNKCKDIKLYNRAIISQNTSKLKKLLEQSSLTVERLDKFILYSNNIVECWKVIMEFQEQETKRTFDRIRTAWKIK